MFTKIMKKDFFLVRINCNTYNQSSYIESTLDGFCMQNTDFSYICTIFDDASTDGQRELLIDYLNKNFEESNDSIALLEETDDYVLRFLRHNRNHNCYFALFLLKYNHYKLKKTRIPYLGEWKDNVKYIALCEGDDYWTSPSKLQKQVDFLENHPECSLTCHRYEVLDEKNKEIGNDGNEKWFKNSVKGVFFDQMQSDESWFTKTLTLVFRTSALEEYWKYPGTRWDIVLVYYLLKHGMGYCFNEIMAVYRRNDLSTYGNKRYRDKKRISYLQHKELYSYEKNSLTRKRYYNAKIRLIFFSRGKAIRDMNFTWEDLLYLPYYFFIGLTKIVLCQSKFHS